LDVAGFRLLEENIHRPEGGLPMTVSDETSASVIEMLSSQQPVTLENDIAIRRLDIDRNLSQIEEWRCNITRSLSTLRTQQQTLDIALQAQSDTSYAEHLREEWEHLRSHPRLAGAEVRASTDNPEQHQSLFLLSTDDLRLHRGDTGESRWLGAFEVELTIARGAIKLRNLNTRRGGRDHPHVVDQRPCFGAHHDAFAQLMSNGDLFVLYELLIQYIETLNLADEYGRYGAYWFEVEDKQPAQVNREHDHDETAIEAVAA
jgi:hypothetical protein